MATKRPAMDLNLDVSTLQSRAVEQPDPVVRAVEKTRQPATKLTRVVSAEAPRTHEPATSEAKRQKGRAGKVSVQTWITKEKRRRLKMLAITTEVSIEEYLAKAIDEILAKHEG